MSILRSHRANQSASKESGARRGHRIPIAVALFGLAPRRAARWGASLHIIESRSRRAGFEPSYTFIRYSRECDLIQSPPGLCKSGDLSTPPLREPFRSQTRALCLAKRCRFEVL
jgi:hypothetical protein